MAIVTARGTGLGKAMALALDIKMAVEKAGLENLDGQAPREARDTYENYDPYGYGTTMDYTDPENDRSSPWTRIYQT